VSKCATNSEGGKAELKIGSPIVIIEAPPVVKTATPMPSLRANTGQVKAGDVGRSVLLDFFSQAFGDAELDLGMGNFFFHIHI
jgi:Protein of unknown function (DUF3148)